MIDNQLVDNWWNDKEVQLEDDNIRNPVQVLFTSFAG